MTFLGARACLAGVLQVPGDAMGPAITHRGAIDICLRNLNAWRAIGCTGAGGLGGAAGVAGRGAGGCWRADAVGSEGFLDDSSDFGCCHGGVC